MFFVITTRSFKDPELNKFSTERDAEAFIRKVFEQEKAEVAKADITTMKANHSDNWHSASVRISYTSGPDDFTNINLTKTE